MKTSTFQRILTGSVLAILIVTSLAASPQPVQAAGSTIVVTTWLDEVNNNSLCSLREAVQSANKDIKVGACTQGSSIGIDEIVLPANLKDQNNTVRNFQVTGANNEDAAVSGDLDILKPVIIRGAGVDKTTIESSGSDRVFHIFKLGAGVATIQNLKITGGDALSGGGILNFGSTLVLKAVHIYSNHAGTSGGGGLRNLPNILVTPNVMAYLTITNSTIEANSNTQSDGGGVMNEGMLTISDSLILNNTAGNAGGGIASTPITSILSYIANTTVTGNIGALGAGIYLAGPMDITNVTIHDNRGSGSVKGLVVDVGAVLALKNTIISGHTDPRDDCEIIGTFNSNGHNLFQDNSCGNTPGDLINTNPGLGSLDFHGGSTQVFSLPDNSPAIDGGSNTGCPSTDQRGHAFGRPADGADIHSVTVPMCDIGAYEADAVPPKIFNLPTIFR
jgi:CSLREA domain-containing protein